MSTEHFRDSELVCKCGCGGLPPQAFQDELEELRLAYDKPMLLSSAHRCPKYNDEVSKSGLDGPHTIGAVDVWIRGADALDLLGYALVLAWHGVGVNQQGLVGRRFIHLDKLEATPGRPRPWIWSY